MEQINNEGIVVKGSGDYVVFETTDGIRNNCTVIVEADFMPFHMVWKETKHKCMFSDVNVSIVEEKGYAPNLVYSGKGDMRLVCVPEDWCIPDENYDDMYYIGDSGDGSWYIVSQQYIGVIVEDEAQKEYYLDFKNFGLTPFHSYKKQLDKVKKFLTISYCI